MKKPNQFEITEKMDIQKNNLPTWTWDEIIRLGILAARIITLDDNSRKYKNLYWLSQKNVKELSAYFV